MCGREPVGESSDSKKLTWRTIRMTEAILLCLKEWAGRKGLPPRGESGGLSFHLTSSPAMSTLRSICVVLGRNRRHSDTIARGTETPHNTL